MDQNFGAGFGLDTPFEDITLIYLASGKSWHIGDNSWRFNLSAGGGISIHNTPINFVNGGVGIFSLFFGNYEYEIEKIISPGFIQKTYIETDITRAFGMAFGSTILITPNATSLTLEISLLFGLVGEKRNK